MVIALLEAYKQTMIRRVIAPYLPGDFMLE